MISVKNSLVGDNAIRHNATQKGVWSMKISRLGSLVLFLALAASVAPLLLAQSFYGTVSGTVTDATGGVLANVKITLTNEGTNDVRTQTTGENGVYTFPQVPPGVYRLARGKQGIQKGRPAPRTGGRAEQRAGGRHSARRPARR